MLWNQLVFQSLARNIQICHFSCSLSYFHIALSNTPTKDLDRTSGKNSRRVQLERQTICAPRRRWMVGPQGDLPTSGARCDSFCPRGPLSPTCKWPKVYVPGEDECPRQCPHHRRDPAAGQMWSVVEEAEQRMLVPPRGVWLVTFCRRLTRWHVSPSGAWTHSHWVTETVHNEVRLSILSWPQFDCKDGPWPKQNTKRKRLFGLLLLWTKLNFSNGKNRLSRNLNNIYFAKFWLDFMPKFSLVH